MLGSCAASIESFLFGLRSVFTLFNAGADAICQECEMHYCAADGEFGNGAAAAKDFVVWVGGDIVQPFVIQTTNATGLYLKETIRPRCGG